MNSVASMINLRGRQVASGLYNAAYSKAFTAEIDLANADDQSDCVLYSKLPSEIRTRIFEYAVASTDDHTKPYLPDRVYYRPGSHYHQKTDISLLLTCKQIYLETRLMPAAQTEHNFWLFGAPFQTMRTKVNGMARFDAWSASLNEEQRQTVNYVRLFAQQYYLENLDQFSRLSSLASITTKQLTLTFRHSDWWSWQSPAESSDKLGICPWLPARTSQQAMLAQTLEPDLVFLNEYMKQGTWGFQISQIKGLSILKIEFEIDVVKKAQLQVVLERAKHWKFPLEGTNTALKQVGEIRESSWVGLADLKDDSSPMLNRTSTSAQQDDRPRRTYYVAEMTWKRVTTNG